MRRRRFVASTLAAVAAAALPSTASGMNETPKIPQRGNWASEGYPYWHDGTTWWHAQTEEHLREEMRCWVGGIEDTHDRMIRQLRINASKRIQARCKKTEIAAFQAPIEPYRAWVREHFGLEDRWAFHPHRTHNLIGNQLGIADAVEEGRTDSTRTPEEWRSFAQKEYDRRMREFDVKFSFPDRRESPGALYLDDRGRIAVRF